MKMEKQIGSPANTKPQAVILAGGKSLRFGADKAQVPWGGQTMLQKIASSLESVGFQIAISTSFKEHQIFGYPILWDEEPFGGPLYALKNILERGNLSKVFLTACDTPFINSILARWLLKESEGYAITVLENEWDQISPLPGIYSSRILPTVRENILEQKSSLRSLFVKKLKIKKSPDKNGVV